MPLNVKTIPRILCKTPVFLRNTNGLFRFIPVRNTVFQIPIWQKYRLIPKTKIGGFHVTQVSLIIRKVKNKYITIIR